MLPIGPLMIEHRLIERVISDLSLELDHLRAGADPDIAYLTTAIDFMRTYADRTHHGKEEDLLFRELATKDLAPALAEAMQSLIQDHQRARAMVGRLTAATSRYGVDNPEMRGEIERALADLVELYPAHIAKEDKEFFKPAMSYFTEDERQALLESFWEFDRAMIHERYRAVAETLEARRQPGR